MARRATAVKDDNGRLEIVGRPVPWQFFEQNLFTDTFAYYTDNDPDPAVSYETLMGWDGWRYGIVVNGTCVAFVDGDEPPEAILGQSVTD